MPASLERRRLTRWVVATVEESGGATYRDAPSSSMLRVERTLVGVLGRVGLVLAFMLPFIGVPIWMGYWAIFGMQGGEWLITPAIGRALLVLFCVLFAGIAGVPLGLWLRSEIRGLRKREILRASAERIELVEKTIEAAEIDRVKVHPPHDEDDWCVTVFTTYGVDISCVEDISREPEARWLAAAIERVLAGASSDRAPAGLRVAEPAEEHDDPDEEEEASRDRKRA